MCLPIHVAPEVEFESHGLACAVVVNQLTGSRCGYVRVPAKHSAYLHPYQSRSLNSVRVHGGLTFAEIEPCVEHPDGRGWWFGFDCSHFRDFSPSIVACLVACGFEHTPLPDGLFPEVPAPVFEEKVELVRKAYSARAFEWNRPGEMPPFDEALCREILAWHAHEHYWTRDEVIAESKALAGQLAAMPRRNRLITFAARIAAVAEHRYDLSYKFYRVRRGFSRLYAETIRRISRLRYNP